MIELSQDQLEAFEAITLALGHGDREVVLVGCAGSGKTTLMRHVIEWAESAPRVVALMAPTGKASARLRELTGRPANTIHKLLYEHAIDNAGSDNALQFVGIRAVAPAGSLVIVDECSMLGKGLYNDFMAMMQSGTQVLFVGDTEQLQPVKDDIGPNMRDPTARLTQVHRQALNSPIIRMATDVRSGIPWTKSARREIDSPEIDLLSEEDAVQWLIERRVKNIDATLLCYSNAKRTALNAEIRTALGYDATVEIGDMLICLRNNTAVGLMNGDTRKVTGIEDYGDVLRVYFDGGHAFVVQSHIVAGSSVADWRATLDSLPAAWRKEAIPVDYGNAITIHKSQGSQWSEVGVVHCDSLTYASTKDKVNYRRLLYTAITRAADRLAIFYR